MQFVSCGKGHYYNPEEHPTCPQCARESAAQGGGYSMDGIGATEPVGSFQGSMGVIGATEPVGGFQRESYNPGPAVTPGVPLDTTYFEDANPTRIENYEPTSFLGQDFTANTRDPQPPRVRPVAGWLVCVDGAAKGRDFRIHSQYNYIGRARHMDICIEGDNSISTENAAILAYDDQQKLFFFAPGQGRNLVRVNGKAVLNPVELQAYDRLTIGKSIFLFIPLCGERFDWNDQQ